MATYSLDHIAQHLGGALHGTPSLMISGVRPFEEAGPDHLTCAVNAKYFKRLSETKAGAIIVSRDSPETTRNAIRTENPYASFARAIALFAPARKAAPGISLHAVVGDGFSHGTDLSVAPGVVIGKNVRVGNNVCLMPNVVLGDQVVLGDDVTVHPNVSFLERCEAGNRVTIHAGTVIGSDGYGFAPDGEEYVKVPQTGIVRLGNDVELGANNTVDRATFGATIIGNGVKTDNMVHVGHNVIVGDNTLLVAQAGISGSTTIGRHVIIAGQAGIGDHVTIGDYSVVAPQSGVAKSIDPGQVMSGTPAMPHRLWLRVQRAIPKLPDLAKEVRSLAKRIAAIEEKLP